MELKFTNRNPDEPGSTMIASIDNEKIFSIYYTSTRPNKYGYYSITPVNNTKLNSINETEYQNQYYDNIEDVQKKVNELFNKYKIS